MRRNSRSNLLSSVDLGAEHFLAALVRTSTDAIIGKTTDGIVIFWNEAAERLYGYSAKEMMGRDIALLFPADRPDELSELLTRVRGGETVVDFLTERVRNDGSVVAVSLTMAPVFSENEEIMGISVIARDLTLYNLQIADLREAHRSANETLSMLETLHSSVPVGLGFFDVKGRTIHLNETLAAVNGSTVDEQVGRLVSERVPEVWRQIEPVFRSVIEHDQAIVNIEVDGELASDPGQLHHWLASYYPVHLESEVIGVGVVVIDVTEQRRSEGFRTNVINNMAEGLITVDGEGRLTMINEAACEILGWTADELIGEVISEKIMVRGDDGEIVANPRELLKIRPEGTSLHRDDWEWVRKDGSPVSVALSASQIVSGDSVEAVIVVFRDITEAKSERLRLEREMAGLAWIGRIREALDEDRFVLYAQPIIPLRGGRHSEELLIRMMGRDGSLIAPVEFLGVAEKFGLINEIDRWVVRQAARIAATGRHVGVNLSAESIVTKDMLSYVKAEIASAGADPSNLVFEITETALMGDIDKGRVFTHGIVEMGSSIALDDFGTGFGTLTHVKNLEVRYLKIDIEFVRGLSTSLESRHVVRAIVDLAQGFGCETIAEGVEDAESLELLREYGVDFAQGFHLGRPAPL